MSKAVGEGLLEAVARRVRESGKFSDVKAEGGRLTGGARDVEEAEYRLEFDADGRLWAAIVTPDRWLSESIESDLLNTGDKIEELIQDELIELGVEGDSPAVEHFRSEDLLFTFRSPVPVEGLGADAARDLGAAYLLAYEACFRQLGDMAGDEED
jgi:hypothetical protein